MTPPLSRYLSKSQFTRGIQCAKSLWLYREKKELRDPTSPEQQAIFDAGTEVGVLAHQWLKGGVLIKADHTNPQAALEETRAAIAAGAKVLYEAAFLHDDVLVRVDLLAQGPGGVWDFYEVKSTTEVKDVFVYDVAIQRYVLEGSGLKLGVGHLVHLDPSYVRSGELDLRRLFNAVDLTADTDKLLPEIPLHLRDLKKAAALAEAPEAAIGPRCTKPYDCDFMGTCWAHVPDYSVFNLSGARMDKKTNLWNAGHRLITDIPAKEKLTAYQGRQREVAISGKPIIDTAPIRELLRGLAYPLHFLDFEAINPAVPPYDGLRPYQQLPFEVSVHVRPEPGAPISHLEYLADGSKDPRYGLVDFLHKHVGEIGSVIAYNKSYEGGILRALAGLAAGAEDAWLLGIERRLWDLADPFRKAYYAHPGFKGRWSIKAVLPVLVPTMTYEGMAIADGAAAMRAYTRLMTEELRPEERAQIMADLRAYCGQDTEAMVRILDHLEQTVAEPARAR